MENVKTCATNCADVNFTQTIEKNTINVSVSNVKTFALIETCASISCISQPFLAKTSFSNAALLNSDFSFIKGVSGQRLKVLGKVVLPISFKGQVYNFAVHVIENLAPFIDTWF